MVVQKYESMRRFVCTEMWKQEEGWLSRNTVWKQKESWLYTNIEAGGVIAGQKYGSRRTDCCTEILQQCKRDGCAEIRKQEERGLYRNMEKGMAVQKYGSRRRDGCAKIWKQEEGWLNRNIKVGGGMAGQKYGSMERDGCTKI